MIGTIVVAAFSLAGTVIGSIAGILTANKLTNYRIEQLEKKVDKHNNALERMYNLEAREDVVEEKIRVANHRIDDLESEVQR